mmetsp:Transcript_40952/g.73354  ORF Transcript_40952/g.73354 Transcript_40952/m.73354 type:complete len:266 (-) Transcript_40952:190-987(-)
MLLDRRVRNPARPADVVPNKELGQVGAGAGDCRRVEQGPDVSRSHAVLRHNATPAGFLDVGAADGLVQVKQQRSGDEEAEGIVQPLQHDLVQAGLEVDDGRGQAVEAGGEVEGAEAHFCVQGEGVPIDQRLLGPVGGQRDREPVRQLLGDRAKHWGHGQAPRHGRMAVALRGTWECQLGSDCESPDPVQQRMHCPFNPREVWERVQHADDQRVAWWAEVLHERPNEPQGCVGKLAGLMRGGQGGAVEEHPRGGLQQLHGRAFPNP